MGRVEDGGGRLPRNSVLVVLGRRDERRHAEEERLVALRRHGQLLEQRLEKVRACTRGWIGPARLLTDYLSTWFCPLLARFACCRVLPDLNGPCQQHSAQSSPEAALFGSTNLRRPCPRGLSDVMDRSATRWARCRSPLLRAWLSAMLARPAPRCSRGRLRRRDGDRAVPLVRPLRCSSCGAARVLLS